jgi:hypothetical protein
MTEFKDTVTTPELNTVSFPLKTGNKYAELGNSITAQGGIRNPGGLSIWGAGLSFAAGAVGIPRQLDLSLGYWPHLYYTAMSAGKVGELEPEWPVTIGERVKDGDIVWEATASRTALNGTDLPAWGASYRTIAQQLSEQRLDEVYINGQSGRKCRDILAYLDRAISKNPDIIHFACMFENDCTSAAALIDIQASWDAYEAAVDRCRALGIRVIVQTVLPSGNMDASSAFTGYSKGNGTKAWNWLNQKIKQLAKERNDVILWDASSVYIDPNNASTVGPWPENAVTYLVASGSNNKKTDAIHPYVSGAFLLGKSFAEVLSANFPKVERFSMSKDDYSISINPLNGGTGTPTAPGTGTTAANMTHTSNGTVNSSVCSQVARTDISGNWVQTVYDASVGNTVTYVNTTGFTPGGNFNIGESIQGFGEIRVAANPTLLKNVFMSSRCVNGVPGFSYSTQLAGPDQDLGQMITADTVFTLKDVPRKIPSGTTALTHFLTAEFRGVSVGTVSFGRVGINRTSAVPVI